MDAPSDDIMEATFCALCDRGYADLTMRDIAAEASCSKAALHYHYDSKHGLLVAFLDYLYERFVVRTGTFDADVDDPDERLREFLDSALHPPREDADDVQATLESYLDDHLFASRGASA